MPTRYQVATCMQAAHPGWLNVSGQEAVQHTQDLNFISFLVGHLAAGLGVQLACILQQFIVCSLVRNLPTFTLNLGWYDITMYVSGCIGGAMQIHIPHQDTRQICGETRIREMIYFESFSI